MHDTELMLALQAIDSAIDDYGHRRSRLLERTALADAERTLATARAALAAAERDAETAASRIEALEASGQQRATKKARLSEQLKRVIAPREAEALMHEIATLDHDQSVADDEELTLMDAVEEAEGRAAAARAAIDDASSVRGVAADALAGAEAEIDAEVAGLTARRSEQAAATAATALARYESLRKQFGGIAITRISAGRCGACHLDQSRTAVEALKAGDESTTIECEQCGRLLAR